MHLETTAAVIRRFSAPRAVDPSVTIQRVQSLLHPMGITRIANITGLDRLGLPVVNAVRPNSRSNSVSQGKGLDLVAAKASAVMEAIEGFCAEHIDKPLKLASAEEMARRHQIPDLEALPQPRSVRFNRGTPILWIEGQGLLSEEPIWLPFELVHVNFTVPAPPGSGCFLLSSNGLASGNMREEAIAHALGELIERDAGALFDATPGMLESRRLDLSSVEEPFCRQMLEHVRDADLAVGLWDITSDTGVPAIRCQMMDASERPDALPLPALGEGCHPDRCVALVRAVTEAAQARLSVIAGVRDDIGPDMYRRSCDPAALRGWQLLLSQEFGHRDFKNLPTREPEGVEGELAYLSDRVSLAGVGEPIVIDLTPPEIREVSILRVIVPGLEPPSDADCRPGQRLTARLAV